jgi:precorrin-3B methylase
LGNRNFETHDLAALINTNTSFTGSNPKGSVMKSNFRQLKIIILTSPSAWGGMEVHTAELANTLAAQGHEVSILEAGSNNIYGKQRFNQVGNRQAAWKHQFF